MKLVLAIVQDYDAKNLTEKLVASGFQSTKLASTGGFLKLGNTTFVIGAEDKQVNDIIRLIRMVCGEREDLMPIRQTPTLYSDGFVAPMTPIHSGGCVIFVMPVERFERF